MASLKSRCHASGEDTCAVISFEKSGQKKIILKFAALDLVARAKVDHEARAEARAEARSHAAAKAEAEPEPEEIPEVVEIEGAEEEEE